MAEYEPPVPEPETVKDEWIVIWFPPDKPFKERHFKDEEEARKFAGTRDVAEWAPLLDHRITTILVNSELVPL